MLSKFQEHLESRRNTSSEFQKASNDISNTYVWGLCLHCDLITGVFPAFQYDAMNKVAKPMNVVSSPIYDHYARCMPSPPTVRGEVSVHSNVMPMNVVTYYLLPFYVQLLYCYTV